MRGERGSLPRPAEKPGLAGSSPHGYRGHHQNTLTQPRQYRPHVAGRGGLFLKRNILPIYSKQGKLTTWKQRRSPRQSLRTSLCLRTQEPPAGSTASDPPLCPRQGCRELRTWLLQPDICMHRGRAAARGRGEGTAGICFVFPSHRIMLMIRHKRPGVFSRHNPANWIAPRCQAGGEFATRGLLQRS